MKINCQIDNMWTLKNGGKLFMKITDEVYDDMSEHWENFRKKPLTVTLQNEKEESLQVPCEVESLRALKKGGTFLVMVGDKDIGGVTKSYRKFRRVPLTMDLQVDGEKQKELMAMISPEQRKMIYAMFRDIGRHQGQHEDTVKEEMKIEFLGTFGQYDDFSLSNCKKELANDFATFLIVYCFKFGIPLKQSPREAFSEVETYLYVCLKHRKCCITGKLGRIHHVQAIGMGRDRRHYDDSKHLKVCLSDEKHTEAHTIGWETFAKKYQVKGIEFTEQGGLE